jgi:hypothetical protein
MFHCHWWTWTGTPESKADRSGADIVSEDKPVIRVLVLDAAAGERGHRP